MDDASYALVAHFRPKTEETTTKAPEVEKAATKEKEESSEESTTNRMVNPDGVGGDNGDDSTTNPMVKPDDVGREEELKTNPVGNSEDVDNGEDEETVGGEEKLRPYEILVHTMASKDGGDILKGIQTTLNTLRARGCVVTTAYGDQGVMTDDAKTWLTAQRVHPRAAATGAHAARAERAIGILKEHTRRAFALSGLDSKFYSYALNHSALMGEVGASGCPPFGSTVLAVGHEAKESLLGEKGTYLGLCPVGLPQGHRVLHTSEQGTRIRIYDTIRPLSSILTNDPQDAELQKHGFEILQLDNGAKIYK
jgi:hypothetical protein